MKANILAGAAVEGSSVLAGYYSYSLEPYWGTGGAVKSGLYACSEGFYSAAGWLRKAKLPIDEDACRSIGGVASWTSGVPHIFAGGSLASFSGVAIYLGDSYTVYCGAGAPTDIPENRPRPERPGVGASAVGYWASCGLAPQAVAVSTGAAGVAWAPALFS